tara:strand:+ start:496 stop:2211 length:1716 start_codon:yes stop_codon:yes gene_type:complete
MPFIGPKPADTVLDSTLIADGSITSAKIADGAIVNADLNNSAAIATSKITGLAASATTDTTNAANIASGTIADARISASSVQQHATSFDDNKILNDISTLGLRVHTQENLNASNSNSASFDVFQDSSAISNLTNANRNSSEYISSVTSQGGTVHSGFNGSRGYDGDDHPTGGGAGSAGNAVQLSGNNTNEQPNGGDGMSTNITGSTVYFGGGGGGGVYQDSNWTAGNGGKGGGGGGAHTRNSGGGSAGSGDTNGLNNAGNGGTGGDSDGGDAGNNTGGGGGAAAHSQGNGGDGGSGIVIVRFATSSQASYSKSGGTASTIGSDTMIQWLSGSGNFVPNANGTARVLIVGAGGSAGSALSGAGAGGEVIEYTSFQLVAGTTYNVSVAGTTSGGTGGGANGGANGASSSFGSQTAKGGGKGYARDTSQTQTDQPNQGGAGADNTRNHNKSTHDASDKSSLAYTDAVSASGSFDGVAITAGASTSKMGAVITYQDSTGTNALNTDIVLQLSADNGSNFATATMTALPDFATGIKMAKVNDLSVTAGTSLKYRISFANQASGSKEARIRGVSLQY